MREELSDPRTAAEYLKAAADFDDPDRFAEAFQTVARLNPTFAYEMVHQIAQRYSKNSMTETTIAARSASPLRGSVRHPRKLQAKHRDRVQA